ncbi:MAG TPA: S9 family peptidase [Pseudonocardiaceae bacterium]|nr:S9 family peptidase [Pseudonocardiaceae bacterium]
MDTLTPELVVDGRLPRSPAVSPDGKWVAYTVAPMGHPGEHPKNELWVTAVDGSTTRRSAVPDGRVSEPRWSSDSSAIFFRSDHDAPGKARLCRITLADDDRQALTMWHGVIRDHVPLVDPELVAITETDEPDRDDDRDDADVRTQPKSARLRLLDTRTGLLSAAESFGGRHVAELAQRPDGGPLAVLTLSSPDEDPGLLEPCLHLFDPETGEATDLGPTPGCASRPAWWRDDNGWHVAYLASTPPGLIGGMAVFDVDVSTGKHRNLTEGLPACPVELVQVADGAPLVVVADGLDTTINRLGADGLTEITRHRGEVDQLSANHDGTVPAAIVSTAHEPQNVHAGLPFRRLTDTRPELADIEWGTQERLSYRAADGLELDGLLVLPVGRTRADGPFPMITCPHGGPYFRWSDQFELHWAFGPQWLAHAGYAVFLPNPRGGMGHGHEFAAMVAGAVGKDDWTDILTGVDLLVAEGIADPDRLGIAGWSQGGFMSAWAVGQTDRFAAAVVGAGVIDWGSQTGVGEWGRFEMALAGTAGWDGPGPHRHDELSPISYVSSIHTPVLIVHGEQDTNVPLGQAQYFHRALVHFGVDHEFVVYPREGHGLGERAHQIDVLRRVRDWFDARLTPATR